MSYGVNKWASTSGRARGAARRKRSARRTGSKSRPRSARPAKKRRSKTTTRAKRRAPARAATRKRAPKKAAKKARLYTRYDPETGQKVRVAADSFEYAEWPSRKPSKKKLQRESLKRDPLGTIAQVGTIAGKRAVERAGERASRDVLRQLGTGGTAAAGVGAARRAVSGLAVPALAAGAGLSLAIALGESLRGAARVSTGNVIEKLSRQFVVNQAALVRATGARSWQEVPKEARDRLVRDYKSAIATASARGGFTRSAEGYK